VKFQLDLSLKFKKLFYFTSSKTGAAFQFYKLVLPNINGIS